MSLTANDLNEIRDIVESAFSKQNSEVIKPILGEIETLRNDIKEIYRMIADLQSRVTLDKNF